MKKRYNITGTPTNYTSYELSFKKRWTKRATEKNDRIVAAGYAERQIADTLSKADPIDLNINTKKAPDLSELIEKRAAVEAIAGKLAEAPEELDMFIEITADILADVPGTKPKRGEWIREAFDCYYCNNCYKPNETRTAYCPNCGAAMKVKKEGK